MSGITGILHLDGRPLEGNLLRRITEAAAARGPDGVTYWNGGALGFSYLARHTTPESVYERQPLADGSGSLRLVLDGRVDNRDELTTELASRGFAPRAVEGAITDAELVLQAYRCWGVQCAARILGDFAFALWDAAEQQLFCARDIIGVRPFYYSHGPTTFVFASELRQVLAHPAVPRRPNEGMAAEYLATDPATRGETLWLDVRRLPPAHSLTLRGGALRQLRYWDVDPRKQIRHRSDEEYAEEYLDVLRQAVRCRMRSSGPVGAHLSGGLDSSSVLAVASMLGRNGKPGAEIEAFPGFFPGQDCDESEYIRRTAAQLGVAVHPANPPTRGPDYYAAVTREHMDFPDYPNLGDFLLTLAAAARARGCGVLLTGLGGNQWFEGRFADLAGLVRRLRWLEAWRLARDVAPALSSQSPARALVDHGVRPLLPPALRQAYRRSRRLGPPPWVSPELWARVAMPERIRAARQAPPFPSYFQEMQYRFATAGQDVHFLETRDRIVQDVEERHPFHDRRIAEFALALPERQRCWREYPRFVMRTAMQGRLPEEVRMRKVQPDFGVLFARALQRLPRESFERLRLAETGWVRQQEVTRMASEAYASIERGTATYKTLVWPLWMVYGMELWVRSQTGTF